MQAGAKPAMQTVFNVHEAKTHLSQLLARVENGETITIARTNRPVALLAPLPAPRQLGTARGQVWISDDFDAPDPDLEAMFNDWNI
ncbi:MAG: type II toxin-antitoxin system Phd/YefM family antitoxin [Terriglobales bacterium]|jgi:prevent-host-death family protein